MLFKFGSFASRIDGGVLEEYAGVLSRARCDFGVDGSLKLPRLFVIYEIGF
jgi:hypothetical protein